MSAKAAIALLAIALSHTAVTGQSAQDTEAANEMPAQFQLRHIEIHGVSGRAVTTDQLLSRSLQLLEQDGVWRVAQPGEAAVTLTLSELSDQADGGRTVDASVLRAIVTEIFRGYSERKVAAVRVSIARESIGRLTADGDGVLVIEAAEGTISGVRAMARVPGAGAGDEAKVASDTWHQRVADGSPVQADQMVHLAQIDHYVNWLNRHPGRRVQVALTPGESPGDLLLDYTVHETPPLTVYFQGSNTGTETTTQWRQRFGLFHSNLTGHDDLLSLDYVTGNFDQVNAVSGSYERPLPALPRVRARVFGTWSEYSASEIGLSFLDLEGESAALGGELAWNFFQHETTFVDLVGGLRYEDFEVNDNILDQRGQTEFLIAGVGLRGDRRTDTSRTDASLSYEANVPGLAGTDSDELIKLGRASTERHWSALIFSASHSFFLEPLFQSNWGQPESGSTLANEIYVSVRGQTVLDDRRVAPGFTQTIGGFYSVRGHDESFTAADNAVIATIEFRHHVPRALSPGEPGELFGKPFRHRPQQQLGAVDWDLIFRAFLDAGRTIHNDRAAFEKHVTLVGAGVGVELAVKRNVRARVDWGFALRDADSGGDDLTAGSSQVHLLLTISY